MDPGRPNLMLKYATTSNESSTSQRSEFIDTSSFVTPLQSLKRSKNDEQSEEQRPVKTQRDEESSADDSQSMSSQPNDPMEDDPHAFDTVESGSSLSMALWEKDLYDFKPYAYLRQLNSLNGGEFHRTDELIPVSVVNSEGPSSFHVILKDKIIDIFYDDMNCKLTDSVVTDTEASDPSVEFAVGDLVLAPVAYKGETSYTRCRVLGVEKSATRGVIVSYEIYCIDIGQKSKIAPSALKKIKIDLFKNIPPQTLHCQLDCTPPRSKYSDKAIDIFRQFICKPDLLMLVKQSLPEEPPDRILVNLVVHEDVFIGIDQVKQYLTATDELVKNGHACPPLSVYREGTYLPDAELLNGPKSDFLISTVHAPRECILSENVLRLIDKFNIKQTELFTVEKTFYSSPENPKKAYFEAIVSEVDSTGRVFARIESESGPNPVNIVCDKLHKALKSQICTLPPFDPSQFIPQQAATALYPSDESFHRVSVISRDEHNRNNFRVLYIDYGQQETIPSEKIFSAVFCHEIPATAKDFYLYEVRLSDIPEVREKSVEALQDLLIDQKCSFAWENAYFHPCRVTIKVKSESNETINVNEWLLQHHGAHYQPELDVVPCEVVHCRKKLRQAYPADRLSVPLGQKTFFRLQSAILFVHNFVFIQNRPASEPDNEFEAKVVENEKKFLEMCSNLNNEAFRGNSVKESFDFGDPCMAKFDEDGRYYRAIVIKPNFGISRKVLFVDYGNMADVKMHDIKELPEVCHLAIPPHAYLIPIFNIRPTKEYTWDQVFPFMQRELDTYDHKLIGDFILQKIGDSLETQVDLYVAQDTLGTVPKHHVFSKLFSDGYLEPIDPNSYRTFESEDSN